MHMFQQSLCSTKGFLIKQRRWLFPGALLLILVGLGLIWLGLQQTSTVIVAGDPIQVRTAAWRVSGVLRAAGVSVGEDDRLTPRVTCGSGHQR